jgi:flagellar motor switch protein FliM
MSDAHALLKLGMSGDRARRACDRLTAEQRGLEGAVRRALPYLVRRKVAVTAEPAAPALHADAVSGLARPFHVTALRVGVGGRSAGALILDGNAIASGLDGMLGSGNGEPPQLDPAGLSAAQAALAARLARGLVAAFDEVLRRAGSALAIATEAASDPQGALVVCSVRIGEGESAGHIVILLPAAAIEVHGRVDEASPQKIDPKTHAAMNEVELEVVAELGRVRLPLARLASLRVGDMIRLPLPVDAPLRLHVGGHSLFEGKPTIRGSQIAVEVLRHGT